MRSDVPAAEGGKRLAAMQAGPSGRGDKLKERNEAADIPMRCFRSAGKATVPR
jgi:hypothetical protein